MPVSLKAVIGRLSTTEKSLLKHAEKYPVMPMSLKTVS